MVKITFIIGVLLLALVFQKNPLWGMFGIGIYLLYRFRRRRFSSNKGLIDSGERNTDHIVFTMTKGFETIAEAIKGEDTEMYYDEDKKRSGYFKKSPVSMDMYKN